MENFVNFQQFVQDEIVIMENQTDDLEAAALARTLREGLAEMYGICFHAIDAHYEGRFWDAYYDKRGIKRAGRLPCGLGQDY